MNRSAGYALAMIAVLSMTGCGQPSEKPESETAPRVLMTEAEFAERVIGNTVQQMKRDRFNKFYFGEDGRYVLAGFAGSNSSLLSIQGGTYKFDDGTICMKREWRDGGQNSGCLTIQTVGEGIRCAIKWDNQSKPHVFTCAIGEGPHPIIAESLSRR